MAKSEQDSMIDQVMQGYGRFKPSDRNTVAKYINENPDYANTVRSRLGIGTPNGGPERDDRYENAQDSQAMKSLNMSMADKGDVAKPAPTAKSGSSAPKKKFDTRMRGDEGTNPRVGMQSERASDEVARRSESDRESQRGKGFSQTNSQAQGSSATTQNAEGGHGLRDAAVGLGVGGTLGYILNKMFPASEGPTVGPQKATGTGMTSNQAPEEKAGLPARQQSRMMQTLDDSIIDVPYRDITGAKLPAPQPQLPPPGAQQSMMPQIGNDPQRMIEMSPTPTINMPDDVQAAIMTPSGPTSQINGPNRQSELDVPPQVMENIQRAVRSRVQKVPKVGRF